MTRNQRKLEVIYLSILVLLPFILLLVIGFFRFIHPGKVKKNVSDDKDIRNSEEIEPYCDDSYLTALVRNTYPDDEKLNLILICSGLLAGTNTGLFVGDCFKTEYGEEPISGYHFVTSGSKFWSKNRNLHNITGSKVLKPRTDASTTSIVAVKVDPIYPPRCEQTKNPLLYESRYDDNKEHFLMGWSTANKNAHVQYTKTPYKKECIENVPSAVIFLRSDCVSGFQPINCDESQEIFIPVSNYFDFGTIFAHEN